MPRPSTFAAVALVLCAVASASNNIATVYVNPGACWAACSDCLESIAFADLDPTLDYYPSLVGSKLYLTSSVLCMDTYCGDNPTALDKGWGKFALYCKLYGKINSVPSMDSIRLLINQSTVVHADILNATFLAEAPQNNTVLPTKENFDMAVRTEHTWDTEMIYHHAYGWALYILVGLLVVIGLGNRVLAAIRHVRPADVEDLARGTPLSTGPFSRIATLWRRHISVPATFGYRHALPWGWLTIPTRLQSILIFIFFAINLIFSCVSYDIFDENAYWPNDKPTQLARYVADRTGIMSFYNLPLLWVLAGRNDVLIWITGWSYQSTNVFHRWVARVATLQAIAHSAAYTWLTRTSLAESFKELYWVTGVVATVLMSLLVFPLSSFPLRTKLYELFLYIHIVLALITLVMLFYHVTIFDHQYDGWLWACVAIWLFDRVLRLVRIAVLSYKTVRAGATNSVARITHSDSGLIRLTVRSSITFTPTPGSYYFLYTLWRLAPWENHPFTLASWEVTSSGTDLHFIIAPVAGATRRLHQRIERINTGDTPMKVLPEGPYGTVHPVASYDRVLLVAGGSGITACLPYVFALVNARHPHVNLVWAARDEEYTADVLAHELAPERLGQHVSVVVHATRDGTATPPKPAGKDEKGSSSDGGSETHLPGVKGHDVHHSRPEMGTMLAGALGQLVGSQRLAVLACGPARMMDDLRYAVAHSYGTGEGKVSAEQLEYFEDTFTW